MSAGLQLLIFILTLQINWCARVQANAAVCPMSKERNAIAASLDIIGIQTVLVVYRVAVILKVRYQVFVVRLDNANVRLLKD